MFQFSILGYFPIQKYLNVNTAEKSQIDRLGPHFTAAESNILHYTLLHICGKDNSYHLQFGL